MCEIATVLSLITPALDPRRLSSLYHSSAVNVTAAPAGTDRDRDTYATITSERHSSITPENLARKWNIGLDTAKRTLQITTQNGVRAEIHPLHRQYRVDH